MTNIKNLKFSSPELLLETLNIQGVPNISNIISKDFGIRIGVFNRYNMLNFNSKLTSNVQGIIDINPDSESDNIIGIDNTFSSTGKRFICTYLFSGYQLSTEEGSYSQVLFEETIYDKRIYYYTLDFLMPSSIFEVDLIQKNGNIESLAEKYNVSQYLVEQKIKKLKNQNKCVIGGKL